MVVLGGWAFLMTTAPGQPSSISEQLLCRNVKRFRGGLVFKARRLVYHSTLGWKVMKKKRQPSRGGLGSTQGPSRVIQTSFVSNISGNAGPFAKYNLSGNAMRPELPSRAGAGAEASASPDRLYFAKAPTHLNISQKRPPI